MYMYSVCTYNTPQKERVNFLFDVFAPHCQPCNFSAGRNIESDGKGEGADPQDSGPAKQEESRKTSKTASRPCSGGTEP
jgi:hypothetical protein